jgi:arginyl-tRNA synthetase
MQKKIEQDILDALRAAQTKGILPVFELPAVTVEQPKVADFGEYTSNVALAVAREAKQSPMVIAAALEQELSNPAYAVSVAAPGYLNFLVTDAVLTENLQRILTEKEQYGSVVQEVPLTINNEFVSANPTGPLHIGNGRGGFFGDSLTQLLRKMGHQVTSEYYVNDGGEQVVKLGHSVLKDDEAVYGGEYIDELHAALAQGDEQDAVTVGRRAAAVILEQYIQKTLTQKMHITYDTFTSERALLESGTVERALERLVTNGHTYEAEGALWLRTTDFGDDKDRVLIKSDGSKTYFAADAGHILTYVENGVDVILETFGADHHGYTKRFEAVARALGFEGVAHFVLMQLVKLEKDGEEVRMSKRAGNVVSVDELIDIVGHDVARFFFLMYSPDTHMTFDLGLAEERSQKNPVFYVQYAHARMASILEKAKEEGLAPATTVGAFTHPKEREVARMLYLFPELLQRAAKDFAPHRLPQMALHMADIFHSFYAACKVIDAEQKELSQQRLALVLATQVVLKETLRLIGVSAPEKM